jgi:TolB-like protein
MESRVSGESGVVMAEEHALVVESPDGPTLTADELERKRLKKREKIRSAWISFVGRIVAQILGAVATISLGLMLVQRYQTPVARPPATPPARDTAPAAVAVRLVTPGEVSLAVLPLQDVSADGEESFARGMTDALITDLVRLDSVRVVSQTSSAIYGKDRRPLPEIGRALGVDFVVEGSVTKGEGRVRIAARLIDARSDEHLLAESYDRPLLQVLTVQAEVARAIARAIRIALASTPHASPGVASGRGLDPLPAILGAR